MVYEDSDLQLVQVGTGYGKDIYGDQIKAWDDVELDHNMEDNNLGT